MVLNGTQFNKCIFIAWFIIYVCTKNFMQQDLTIILRITDRFTCPCKSTMIKNTKTRHLNYWTVLYLNKQYKIIVRFRAKYAMFLTWPITEQCYLIRQKDNSVQAVSSKITKYIWIAKRIGLCAINSNNINGRIPFRVKKNLRYNFVASQALNFSTNKGLQQLEI